MTNPALKDALHQCILRSGLILIPGWAMVLILVSGCGGSGHFAGGIVQFTDGEPVQSGSIEFRSTRDSSRYASRIDADGTFTLTDANGDADCPPGEYDVVVVQIVLTEDLAADKHEHGRTVPRRYADYYTSGLRVSKLPDSVEPILVLLEPDAE